MLYSVLVLDRGRCVGDELLNVSDKVGSVQCLFGTPLRWLA